MFTVVVNASYLDEIKEKALELKGYYNVETYYNIHYWVENNIKYEFYNRPRGVELTWKTMIGDCTDNSMIKKQMLDYHNITNRLVHGWVINNNVYEKHDWIEVDFKQDYYIIIVNNETFNIYDKELALWVKERLNATIYTPNYGWYSIEYENMYWDYINKTGIGIW
jgi:hypothetical protein